MSKRLYKPLKQLPIILQWEGSRLSPNTRAIIITLITRESIDDVIAKYPDDVYNVKDINHDIAYASALLMALKLIAPELKAPSANFDIGVDNGAFEFVIEYIGGEGALLYLGGVSREVCDLCIGEQVDHITILQGLVVFFL